MEQKFAFTVQRGFHHFEGDFGHEDRKKIKQRARDYGLTLGYLRFGIRSTAEMSKLIAEAQEVNASYIVAIVGKAYYSVEQSVNIVGQFIEMAASTGLPLYIETHRDSVTQDLMRCTEIIRQLPSLSLILDFSHMLVSGEITEDLFEEYLPLFKPLCERAVGIHGRISNGNQIQVSLESADDYIAQRFNLLWIQALKEWKRKEFPEPFRFTLELGPPSYALTSRNEAGLWIETFDRVMQGSLLVELFKQAWNKSE